MAHECSWIEGAAMKVNEAYNVTEVELSYRNKVKAKDRPKVKGSSDAYEILKQAWDMNKIDLQEEFKILMLDRAGHCLGIASIASGSMSACVVDPKLIFVTALKAKSSSIILAHNHPSGNFNASDEDERLTRRLSEAGNLLEIAILDHLIMTSDGYKSMADDGNSSLTIKSMRHFTR